MSTEFSQSRSTGLDLMKKNRELEKQLRLAEVHELCCKLLHCSLYALYGAVLYCHWQYSIRLRQPPDVLMCDIYIFSFVG